MKRFPALLTAAAMLFSLTACGSNGGTEQTADPPSTTSAEQPPVTTTADTTTEAADQTEESKPIFASEEDKAAFELLGDYTAEHLTVPNRHVELHVSGEDWELSEDYELFRRYFFGTWEEDNGDPPLVIDDSENSWFARNCHSHYFMDFYKVGEDVLVFETGSAPGGSLYWLDRNEPDTLYTAEGAPGGSPNGIFSGEDGFPHAWVLHKNDTAPNEPENNYLSVYRLREMAQKQGIDYELLVYVELETIPWTGHDSRYYFYPMYLVSEADDRIEIVTRAGDVYSYDFEIRIILQKIDGEWGRTVEFDDTAESSEEGDRSALDMIDYTIFEGEAYLHFDEWQESDDFDLYRRYFFGTWENAGFFGGRVPLYVIDDSENTFLMNQVIDDDPENMSPLAPVYRFTGFYEFSENVLAFMIDREYECLLFWLDKNDPDRMYMEVSGGGGWLHGVTLKNHKPFIFTKTDAPPNEPGENFLSIYKLREISRDYGIDLKLLIDIEVEGEEITTRLFHDDWYQFYPVYLVSEAPDRLELKTQVGDSSYENSEIDVSYTLEKVGGEWVRTVEYDDEAGSP